MRDVTKKKLIIFSLIAAAVIYFMYSPTTKGNIRKVSGASGEGSEVLNIVEPVDDEELSDSMECVLLRTAVNGGKICLHPVKSDIHVSGWLAKGGIWEPHIVTAVLYVIRDCPNCAFIDIGANIGVFTISLATQGHQVVAVEPARRNLQRLSEGIRRSGIKDKVVIVANALSDGYRTLKLYAPLENAGGTTGIKEKDALGMYNQTVDLVKTVKMNDLVGVIDSESAVMKIDIEGMEPYAFRAAEELFDQVDIKYVFMEWSKKGNADENLIQPMLDFFTSRGYLPYDIFNLRSPLIFGNRISARQTKEWPFDVVWRKYSNPFEWVKGLLGLSKKI